MDAAFPFRLVVLRQRADFLAVAKGRRAHGAGFTLQYRRAGGDSPSSSAMPAPISSPLPAPLRFGFTITKKTGNAPERNRIRRRLRAALRQAELDGIIGDFVLIGRREALDIPFAALVAGLSGAIHRLAQGGGQPARARKAGSS